MHELSIEKLESDTYGVVVTESAITNHQVTLSPEYYQKLTGGAESPEKLIERSFEFLLEREHNTMILTQFDLPVIGEYFPEYEETIKVAT